MKITELTYYELANIPFAEYISNDFLQSFLAKFLARRVNKKWDKYQIFLKRKAFVESILTPTKSVNK